MADGVEWVVSPGLTPYQDAVAAMEARVAGIRDGVAREQIWLVEHPELYTAGTSANPADLLDAERLPVITTGRGGKHTWHGPGQRVTYVMLDLDAQGRDLRGYVATLERWVIDAIGELGIDGQVHAGRTGVWVGDAKVAAIGVRVRRWVSYHGFALNICPELSGFEGIRPCGLDLAVTSLAALGSPVTMSDVDLALWSTRPACMRDE